MGTPALSLIATALQARLEGITVAGGYRTTVATVESVVRPPEDVGKPWIGWFFDASDDSVTEPFDTGVRKQRVTVVGYVDGGGSVAARRTAVLALDDDIKVALYGDPTLSGSAWTVSPISHESNATGTPAEEDDFGVVVHVAEIIYAVRLTQAD